MTTTLYTERLVPLIDALSQNISEIASILKADVQTVEIVREVETQEKPKKESSPKSKISPQAKEAAASGPDSLTGSSKESKPVITIEQVRAVLAEKSQAGLTAQVKDLLTSFGSVKLSGIDPAKYEDLMEAAKELK